MKKIFVIACMMLMSTAMFAQAGKFAVGVNANYGMNSDYKSFGFGAKFQYEFIENFRAEASGNYFLKKDNISLWDANVNFHYIIPLSEGLNVYPLAGIALVGIKWDVSGSIDSAKSEAKKEWLAAGGTEADFEATWPTIKAEVEKRYSNKSSSDTNIGFNVGAGIEYYVSDNIKLNAEVKYQIVKDMNRPVISIGAAYCF